MNLEESNKFVEDMEKNSRNRKEILTIIIACAGIVLFLVILVLYLKYQDSKTLKIYYDDSKINISSNLIKEENGEKYFNVKQLALLFGYSYQQGEYNKYNEDSNSCFIQNDYTIIAMTSNENSVSKYLINNQQEAVDEENKDENEEKKESEKIEFIVYSDNNTCENVSLSSTIKYIDNGLYASISDISKIFNVVSSTSSDYKISFYSLEYMINYGINLASSLGYKEISDYYEDAIAIVDNMLVVSDGKKWGVLSLASRNEIISMKYEKLIYMQESKDFLVFVEDSIGVISSDGNTLIKPTEYDQISKLGTVEKIDEETQENKEEKLYLAEKNGKYGVINDNNEIIIDIEYDKIGIENINYFTEETFENEYILFDEFIPVKSQNKIGIIDIYGTERVKCVYNSLGCIQQEEKSDENDDEDKNSKNNDDDTNNEGDDNETEINVYGNRNVLTIPETTGIKGIVIEREGLYGIYDANSKNLIIPCAFTKIYSRKKSNILTYYLEYNEEEIELNSYLEENNLKTIL